MKTSLFYLAFLAVASSSLCSCDFNSETIDGNGNIKNEARDLGNIKKINLMGDMDVYVDQGTSAVKVEGDENILRYVETSVHDGWLVIKTRDHFNIHSSNPVKVYVTTPDLSNLKVNGSGNIISDHKFSSDDNMSFGITGSGNITANVNAPAVNADITGSGNMLIKGETRNAKINITGSGNYDGPELKAENAEVQISGSGDASLFADGDLKATIAGSGDVKYKGNAAVHSHIAGSGSVQKVP